MVAIIVTTWQAKVQNLSYAMHFSSDVVVRGVPIWVFGMYRYPILM